MPSVKDRFAANMAILASLTALAKKHQDWRFHQLLQNAGVSLPGEDQFYEESGKTLDRMRRA